MHNHKHKSRSERLGHWAGRVWRGYLRRERKAIAWLTARGVPASGAVVALWIVKLGVLAVLSYAALWLALVVVLVVALIRVGGHLDQGEPMRWPPSIWENHKDNLFYHPRNYDDDPDPRFDDD